MRSVIIIYLCLFSVTVFGREFQVIDPALDQQFISDLGMHSLDSVVPRRFNLLIVGQDDSPSDKKNQRALLGSRADILMV
ncbi:MAG: hypothetical protein IT287_05435, partial [Bdellovibrionaceae bacterium]|nr:hypothetical protein [Pseudobdellovibrionaceae bacterium]